MRDSCSVSVLWLAQKHAALSRHPAHIYVNMFHDFSRRTVQVVNQSVTRSSY